MEKESRQYGGVSQEARVDARREKLLQAALSLIARHGPAGAAVTAICAEAGLTTRYFYESFASREALLLALFERASDRLIENLERAAGLDDPIEAVLCRLLAVLQERPALTKMFLVDFQGQDPAMRRIGLATADRLSELLAPGLTSPLARAGLAGAVMRTARAWIEGGAKEPVDEVIALQRRFVEAASR